MLAPLFVWLESTRLAVTIGGSLLLTASLSSIHLLGMTLVGGGALVSGLRLLGVMLPQFPVRDVAGVARRGIGAGLAISVVTGTLLFAPKASATVQSGYFQVKMLLLVTAVAFHVSTGRIFSGQGASRRVLARSAGVLGAALWLGVILAGCAFILLEG